MLAVSLCLSGPSPARAAIALTVTPTENTVVFRFLGLRPCDSVVANATVIQWLGPQVEVVVRRGTKVVTRGAWLACTYRQGLFQPWYHRPKASNGNWLPVGRKNVLTLLQAYCSLPPAAREQCPLILAGGWGWKSDRVAEYFQDVAASRNVIHLGYTEDRHLPRLYAGARALVYPSHYEGFGLPPIEMLLKSRQLQYYDRWGLNRDGYGLVPVR